MGDLLGTGLENGAPKELSAGDIYVDAEGDWFYQGSQIIRQDILAFFYDHLECDADHSYKIVWGHQRCGLRVEDTPFVISRVDRNPSGEAGGERVTLTLKHGLPREPLDPKCLWVGKDHVLYTRVRSGRFLGRFSRPAYYQLAEWIQEEPATGRFFLEIGGEQHQIRICE